MTLDTCKDHSFFMIADFHFFCLLSPVELLRPRLGFSAFSSLLKRRQNSGGARGQCDWPEWEAAVGSWVTPNYKQIWKNFNIFQLMDYCLE